MRIQWINGFFPITAMTEEKPSKNGPWHATATSSDGVLAHRAALTPGACNWGEIMPSLKRDGVRITFEDVGEGPAIVLIHGFLMSGEMWREQVPRLVETHRVINVDLRGHGGSSSAAAPIDLYDLTDDVIHVLDSVGVGRAVWAGLSIGGMIALRAALTAPDRVAGLILLDTDAGTESLFRAVKYMLMAAGSRFLGVKPFLPAMSRLMFGRTTRRRNPRLVREWKSRFGDVDFPSRLHYVRCLVRRDSILDRLQEIGVPVLVMVGEEDASLPPKRSEGIVARVPDARLAIIPEAGHITTLEQPERVNEEMRDFLRDRMKH